MSEIAGKTAFVTGAASGLGFAITQSLASAGARVMAADVEEAPLQALAAQFSDSNLDVSTVCVDVTNREAMADAAASTGDRYGDVHILVNNAGVAVGGPLSDMSSDDWDWVLDVNLAGVANGLQAFLPGMLAHGEGGHIVNTASMAGHLAIPQLGVYNASKFAVVAISDTLRVELEPSGIGVSVLCPGMVNTNIFTSGRNRPGGSNDPADQSSETELEAIRAAAIDPSVVGEMVLHAITSNQAYIFTHPEFKDAVAERHSQIMASFEHWASIRDRFNG